MKVATKALTTMLIIAMISFSSATASALTPDTKSHQPGGEKKLERVYRHHDRKLELRASVLGMTAAELREELRVKPFDTVIKQHGFKTRQSFYTAVTGKVKDELRRRGWSDQKIDKFLQKRLSRVGKFLPRQTAA
jgi:hypothetical protein